MTLTEIFTRVTAENAASKEKYGPWRDIAEGEQAAAIRDEFAEWYAAYVQGDVDGPHGELRELVQLANCCVRRIQFLTGVRDA